MSVRKATPDLGDKRSPKALSLENDTADVARPTGVKLMLITISLMLAVFCVALDNTVYFPVKHLILEP